MNNWKAKWILIKMFWHGALADAYNNMIRKYGLDGPFFKWYYKKYRHYVKYVNYYNCLLSNGYHGFESSELVNAMNNIGITL